VTDQQEIGARARDDLAAHLVGRGAHDRAPEGDGEGGEENREEESEPEARRTAGARGALGTRLRARLRDQSLGRGELKSTPGGSGRRSSAFSAHLPPQPSRKAPTAAL